MSAKKDGKLAPYNTRAYSTLAIFNLRIANFKGKLNFLNAFLFLSFNVSSFLPLLKKISFNFGADLSRTDLLDFDQSESRDLHRPMVGD